MQVPISVAINTTKNNIIKDINTSGLPLCIVEMIVKGIHDELTEKANAELNADVARLNEEKKAKESETGGDADEREV